MCKPAGAPIVLLGVSAVLFFTSSCAKTPALASSADSGAGPASVAVTKVAPEDLSRGLVLTAEFRPYQEVDVMAKVAGYVKQIYVDVGDHVRQNQLLATLEIPEMVDDLNRAGAAVERSKSDVQRATDELQRAEVAHQQAELWFKRLSGVVEKKPGLVAQQEIDDARSRDLAAEAQVSAAKSALAMTREQVRVNDADVHKVHTLMDYTRVTAPFDGVVTRRFADTGSMIQAGTASHSQAMPVVRISQNSRLRLILPVPESAVPSVAVGRQVEVRVPALGHTFPGRVERFASRIGVATRTMETEVDVVNPGTIVPGMYAEVSLVLNRRTAVLSVPVMAVDRDNDTSGRVLVITANHRVEPRKIALGLETAHSIEVRSGLNEGDLVVLSGRSGLQEGQEVQPRLTALTATSEGSR